jgi:hypothetical protein
MFRVSQRTFGVMWPKTTDIKELSIVSATLSQPTPFKSHRFKIHLNLSKHTRLFSNSNSYKFHIQDIHIIIYTYTQIAKYFIIFKFIVCGSHFYIVQNSKLHHMFKQHIFHKYIVEETPLMSRSCRRIRLLHGRSHGARTCTSLI